MADGEREPLLNGRHDEHENDQPKTVEFLEDDPENPRNWSFGWKLTQTLQLFVIGFVCPMASSIIAPAAGDIAQEFNISKQIALLGQAGFICMLGIGPLFHAPMSETFGRRIVYLVNLMIFTLLQIPTALAPNAAVFVAVRTLGGFFGSVGVANGGGSVSDMFETHQRAQVLGFYLCSPLLGPSIGPLIGSIVLGVGLDWRWIFWLMTILSATVTVLCYCFLNETRAVTILLERKSYLERQDPKSNFKVEGENDQSIISKIASNSTKAVKILVGQPIVLIMSLYQALVFSSMYSLYAQYTSIWSAPPYRFSTIQIGLAYLGPALGFVSTAIPIVAYVDRLYSWLARWNDHKDGRPEYRLPLANFGAIFLPVSLFWLGWTIEKGVSWPIPLAATLFFGGSQVSIFNAIQTYYVDAFESSAASALAAGAFLRSTIGGIVPLFVGKLFDSLGYGWGMSVFGILSLLLLPAPMIFYWTGERLRERFSSA